MRPRPVVLLLSVLLISTLVLGACGGSNGGGATTIKGQVTRVDTGARTFSVSSGGKNYDFKLVGDSKGDIAEIKEHMDQKKEIEVKYRGTYSPYDVVSAD